jgi:hypothetical protein
MEHQEWSRKEAQLWRQVNHPKRRRPVLHSIPKTQVKRRRKIQDKIEKERDREFAAEWAALTQLLHLSP